MKVTLRFLVFVSAMAMIAWFLFPSAILPSVQGKLWPHKKEAMAIRERILAGPNSRQGLTPAEEINGWKYSAASDGGYAIRKRLFVWSSLEMKVRSNGTFTWIWHRLPFTNEYLYVAP